MAIFGMKSIPGCLEGDEGGDTMYVNMRKA